MHNEFEKKFRNSEIKPMYTKARSREASDDYMKQDSLNVELGRLCPFSAPRGHTFSTCPPKFPPRVFHGQIFTPDKHKVSAPNAPRPKVIQIIHP